MEHFSTFRAGDLTAVIGDNAGSGNHRAGYNGVWSLVHKNEPDNLFVPEVAGLNFEHIFDGDKRDEDDSRKIFFEPRHAPMTFEKLSARAAELHQPPTSAFHLESWTRLELVAPHYLDITFRFKPTQHCFAYGYIGLFWANYINAPEDKSIYFRDRGRWIQLCTQEHNDESTVSHRDDKLQLKFSEKFGPARFKNMSRLRFDEPFFYGLFKKQIFIVMFDRTAGMRFTHSPSGGGDNKDQQTTLPAWDFQWILPNFEVLTEYTLRARVVYRSRCSRTEIVNEFSKWKLELSKKGVKE
ncbi:MAG: hypothetical protein ACJ8FY_00550 [Gemmataceae bacterium]